MDQRDATSGRLLIDARDADQAEEQITATFGTFRVRTMTPSRDTRIRVWRTYAGSLGVDDVEYTYDVTYDMDPPDEILLCRVVGGVFEETHRGQPTRRHGPGSAVAFGAIPHPLVGRLDKARYHMIGVPRRALAQVAGDHPDCDAVRLTSTAPVSASANQHLIDVVDHIRHGLVSNPSAAQQPLVISTLEQYLAASMLAAFPHTRACAVSEANDHDKVRRAIAFIDDNAHRAISMADVAHAARTSAATLDTAIRRHLGCSPMQHLRQVRLARAHDDLVAADPTTTSVADIARKWGFWRLSSFSAHYRREYRNAPESTLER